ncbi:hypothetical protein B0H19DRAFT_1066699 [Mycena capillaripes]|nr:hypothetical protein B0H19DRAFT_1066699 [Mycena capillaripes]
MTTRMKMRTIGLCKASDVGKSALGEDNIETGQTTACIWTLACWRAEICHTIELAAKKLSHDMAGIQIECMVVATAHTSLLSCETRISSILFQALPQHIERLDVSFSPLRELWRLWTYDSKPLSSVVKEDNQGTEKIPLVSMSKVTSTGGTPQKRREFEFAEEIDVLRARTFTFVCRDGCWSKGKDLRLLGGVCAWWGRSGGLNGEGEGSDVEEEEEEEELLCPFREVRREVDGTVLKEAVDLEGDLGGAGEGALGTLASGTEKTKSAGLEERSTKIGNAFKGKMISGSGFEIDGERSDGLSNSEEIVLAQKTFQTDVRLAVFADSPAALKSPLRQP